MRKKIPVDIVDDTIAKIRATKSVELGNVRNESPDRSAAPKHVADTVDRALTEVGEALKDALSRASQDEQSEESSWWTGHNPEETSDWWREEDTSREFSPSWWDKGEGHPEGLSDLWRGGIAEDNPLPRGSSPSWWNG